MKKPLIYMILGGAIVFLLMQNCKGEKQTEPRQGTLISKQTEIKHDTIKITEFKDRFIEKSVIRWQKQKDSLKTIFVDLPCDKKDSVYFQAIEPKMFQWQTEDDNLIADIRGITTGDVKHIELNYLIKPEQKAKDKNFSLSAGAGLNVIRAGVGYKGFEVDYLRVNGQDFATVGYRFKF
jgi:hypothetical protein